MNETLVSSGNSTEGRIVRLTIIVVVVIIIGDVILRTGASAVDGADPLSAFPSQGLAFEAVTLD